MRTISIVAALMLGLLAFMPGTGRCTDLDESYYPLKEGLQWEYKVTTDGGKPQKLTITNLAPREVNGVKVTPRKWEMGGRTFIELMEKTDSGIYRYGDQAAENAPPAVLNPKEYHLKFPIADGNSWNMTTKVGTTLLTLTLTIESVSDNVTMPAGNFKDCLKVKQTGDNNGISVLGYEWSAPNVGVVKSTVVIKKRAPDGKEVTESRTYELVSFRP